MIGTTKLSSNVAALLELMPLGQDTVSEFIRSLRKGADLWDPWILKDGDVYRLFYLTAPKSAPGTEFWSQGTIAGAVSKDLYNWQHTGIVLEPNSANSWESGRMLAGSTYKEDGIYYLFYSASGGGSLLKDERICLATSTDGLNWKRASFNPFFSIEERDHWYGVQKDTRHFHWRDPYVLKEPVTGRYYMFISAHLKHETLSPYQGCVGLAVSDNIGGPYELLPPVASSNISGIKEWPFVEMERPQVIYKNGKYHLFFSCWNSNLNPKWLMQLGLSRSKLLKKLGFKELVSCPLFWFISDKVTGPFKPAKDLPIVRGSGKIGIYGTNFFPILDDQGKFLVIGWYHRLRTLQVSHLFEASFKGDSIEIAKNRIPF